MPIDITLGISSYLPLWFLDTQNDKLGVPGGELVGLALEVAGGPWRWEGCDPVEVFQPHSFISKDCLALDRCLFPSASSMTTFPFSLGACHRTWCVWGGVHMTGFRAQA